MIAMRLRGVRAAGALVLAGSLAGALAGSLAGCSGSSDAGAAGSTTAATATRTVAVTPTPTATRTKGAPTAAPTTPPKKGGPALAPTGAPSVAISFAPPVKAGRAAPLATGVQVTTGKIRTVSVGANGPGEVAGPAVVIPLSVRNDSGKPFNLGGLAVNVTYHQGTPGDQTTAGPSKPFRGSLRAGATAKGTYVFTVPKKYASSVVIQVASDQSPTIVQFSRT